MALQNPYSAYANNAVNTASKEKLTLMLYDGALKFANQAILALEEKKYVKLNEAVKRTMDIISELQITLNRKYEISNNLYALYDYINYCLVEGGADWDKAKLEEARDLIREFRDLWKELILLSKK